MAYKYLNHFPLIGLLWRAILHNGHTGAVLSRCKKTFFSYIRRMSAYKYKIKMCVFIMNEDTCVFV